MYLCVRDKGNNNITEHRAIIQISQQPENRNGSDLVQAFPKISILPLSTIFVLDSGIILTVLYVLFFFILNKHIHVFTVLFTICFE